MRLTANQLVLLLAIHRGSEVDETETGTYSQDRERLLAAGLIEPEGGDDPGHRLTTDGDRLVRRLQEVDVADPEHSTDLPELVALPEPLDGGEAGLFQVGDHRPTYLVANASVRMQDCRPEPALVRPPVTVYGNERRAAERAIGLAVANRGLNFLVLRTLSVYRCDPRTLDPVRRF